MTLRRSAGSQPVPENPLAVLVGLIFHLQGEAIFARMERRRFGYRPGLQGGIALEPEVIMQPSLRTLLDDEQ
jgi:hypothetical protein